MRSITITRTEGTFRRISKAQARRRYRDGLPFHICPVKLAPGGSWGSSMQIDPKGHFEHAYWRVAHLPETDAEKRDYLFDKLVREFEWYNANAYETGYYASFYVLA